MRTEGEALAEENKKHMSASMVAPDVEPSWRFQQIEQGGCAKLSAPDRKKKENHTTQTETRSQEPLVATAQHTVPAQSSKRRTRSSAATVRVPVFKFRTLFMCLTKAS